MRRSIEPEGTERYELHGARGRALRYQQRHLPRVASPARRRGEAHRRRRSGRSEATQQRAVHYQEAATARRTLSRPLQSTVLQAAALVVINRRFSLIHLTVDHEFDTYSEVLPAVFSQACEQSIEPPPSSVLLLIPDARRRNSESFLLPSLLPHKLAEEHGPRGEKSACELEEFIEEQWGPAESAWTRITMGKAATKSGEAGAGERNEGPGVQDE